MVVKMMRVSTGDMFAVSFSGWGSGVEGDRNRVSDREQSMSDGHGGVFVAGTEDVEVVEGVVELVDAEAVFELFVVAVGFVVCGEACLRETTEKAHHGDIGPGIADGDGGVDDGDAGGVGFRIEGGDGVARPEIAVDQGGGGVAGKKIGEAVDDAIDGVGLVAGEMGVQLSEFELIAQSAIGVELDPIVATSIGLRGRAQEVVAGPAVGRRRGRQVVMSEIAPEAGPDGIFVDTRRGRRELFHEQDGVAVGVAERMDAGDEEMPGSAQSIERIGFGMEAVARISRGDFGHEAALFGQDKLDDLLIECGGHGAHGTDGGGDTGLAERVMDGIGGGHGCGWYEWVYTRARRP